MNNTYKDDRYIKKLIDENKKLMQNNTTLTNNNTTLAKKNDELIHENQQLVEINKQLTKENQRENLVETNIPEDGSCIVMRIDKPNYLQYFNDEKTGEAEAVRLSGVQRAVYVIYKQCKKIVPSTNIHKLS